jgi:hypothetical protein
MNPTCSSFRSSQAGYASRWAAGRPLAARGQVSTVNAKRRGGREKGSRRGAARVGARSGRRVVLAVAVHGVPWAMAAVRGWDEGTVRDRPEQQGGRPERQRDRPERGEKT